MNNTDFDRDVELALNLRKLGLRTEIACAVDAWKAASYKSPHIQVNAQGAAVPAPQPISVAGRKQKIRFSCWMKSTRSDGISAVIRRQLFWKRLIPNRTPPSATTIST